jgi:hypothetical protein
MESQERTLEELELLAEAENLALPVLGLWGRNGANEECGR